MEENMNKPVVWTDGDNICPEIIYEARIIFEHPQNLDWTPIYTYSVKETIDSDMIKQTLKKAQEK